MFRCLCTRSTAQRPRSPVRPSDVKCCVERPKILIIEDDHIQLDFYRKWISSVFASKPVEITHMNCIADENRVLEKLADTKFDILFTEASLGRTDCIQLLEKATAKKVLPGITKVYSKYEPSVSRLKRIGLGSKDVYDKLDDNATPIADAFRELTE